MALTDAKVYVMRNEITGVTVKCTSKYLVDWVARGTSSSQGDLQKYRYS